MSILRILISVFTLLFITCDSAYAYLDPGTGSPILQALIGFLVLIIALMRNYWVNIKILLKKYFLGCKQ
jgi:hypothetical protein